LIPTLRFNPKYVEISRKKLEDTTPTIINGCYVSVFLNRIVTIRDIDYEKVKDFLKTKKPRINKYKSKQMTLPFLES